MPNFFATFALATYPLFIVGLFLVYRPPVAVALAFLLAELLLPPEYNLPLSSPKWLNKATIPPLATIMAALFFARSYLRRSRPLRGVEWLFVLMFVGSYFTMSTNQDPMRHGPTTVPGEQFGDFTSDAIRTTVGLWIAFYLGRVMFKTSRDLVSLCKIMAVAALFYTLPALWEIRMSPQIQSTVYGYGQGSFLQSMRWGGYRPNVFTNHGLELAMIFLLCLVLLVALARARRRVGPFPTTLACLYLAFVLVMCKSAGAMIYALLFVPLLAFGSPKAQLRMAVLLVAIFVAYPLLRFGDLIPTKDIGDFLAQHLSADRAQSLSYRFEMEQGLLNNTRLRPWFGWGGYGRAFIYDDYSGRALTIPDGWVILQLSTRGLVGFFAYFGPFVAAVVRAYRVVPRIKDRSARLLLCALTLACAVVLFDLIINSTFPPILMLLFGALWTLPTAIVAKEAAAEAAAVEANVAETAACLPAY
jgi:hypothetical protein